MTSPIPECRSEILERAKTLLDREGVQFTSQKEVLLKGLPFAVIIVHLQEDDKVVVFYDTPSIMCVVSTHDDLVPDVPFVCDDTATRVLKLMQQRMILDDLIEN